MKPVACGGCENTEKSKKKGRFSLSFLFFSTFLIAVAPAAVFAAIDTDRAIAVDSSDNVYAGGVESTSTGQTGKVSKFDGVFQ